MTVKKGNIVSSASAPGKVILFGEHAVVYGPTAVAAALSDLRIQVNVATVESNELTARFEDILDADNNPISVSVSLDTIKDKFSPHYNPYHVAIPDDESKDKLSQLFENEMGSVASGMMSITYLAIRILSDYIWGAAQSDKSAGLTVTVQSMGLPIGAGLGSSASFSVATAAACIKLLAMLDPQGSAHNAELTAILTANPMVEITPNEFFLKIINKWAYASEILLHGSPSGLDNTTSCYGGLVKFSRKDGDSFENIDSTLPLNILLVNTKVPGRSTKHLVAGVRALYNDHKNVVVPILDSINNISLEFLGLVEKFNKFTEEERAINYQDIVHRTGRLMSINHQLLNALGVGHPTLNAVVEAASTFGEDHYITANGEQGPIHTSSMIGKGFAAKLTGAGGGGCAIILTPHVSLENGEVVLSKEAADGSAKVAEEVKLLINAIRSMDCDIYHSTVAGKGVVWLP